MAFKHKLDLFLSISNILINLIFSLIFLMIIFKTTPLLNGWNTDEIVLIYGIFLFNKGISDTVTYGLYNIERYVQRGILDGLLLKPISVLGQILTSDIDFGQIVNIITGVVLSIISLVKLSVTISGITLLIMFLSLVFSVLVVFSTRLLAMSLAFWTQTSFPIAISVDNLSEFCRYPLSIYSKILDVLLTFFIPFAIFGYLPAAIITQRISIPTFILCICTIPILFIFSIYIWKRGLKRYQSSGY